MQPQPLTYIAAMLASSGATPTLMPSEAPQGHPAIPDVCAAGLRKSATAYIYDLDYEISRIAPGIVGCGPRNQLPTSDALARPLTTSRLLTCHPPADPRPSQPGPPNRQPPAPENNLISPKNPTPKTQNPLNPLHPKLFEPSTPETLNPSDSTP